MEEMPSTRKLCEICSQPTINERMDETEPHEGHRTTCCDRWVCDDCVCWVETDEKVILCKDCCGCDDEENLFGDLDSEDFFEYPNENLYTFRMIISGVVALIGFALIAFGYLIIFG
jgi:hypothetical protein